MQNYILLIVKGLFVVLAALTACQRILDNLLTFHIDYQTSFTVPSALVVNTPFQVPSPPVQTQINQRFENNGTTKDRVKNIILRNLKLDISQPAQASFRLFRSIEIYISAEGEPSKRIAWNENIPANAGRSIELETTPDNLDAYLKKDTFELEARVVMREAPLYEITFDADMRFRVTADPL